MARALAFLLPDSMLGLAIAGVGLAIIFGMNARRGFGLVGLLLLFVVLAPFIESLFYALPLWLTLLLLGWIALRVARVVLALIFGRGAASQIVGHVVGGLILAVILGTARVTLAPVRFAGRGIGRLMSGRLV